MTKNSDACEWTKHRNRLLLHAGVSSGSALVAGRLIILSPYWSPLLMVGAGAAASFALMGLLENSRNLKVLLEPPKVRSQFDTLARLEEGQAGNSCGHNCEPWAPVESYLYKNWRRFPLSISKRCRALSIIT